MELLKTEKFEFNTDEQVIVNRKDEPHPADLDEARRIWRQRLRSEYLQEKIAKYAAKKKAERSAASKTNSVAKVEETVKTASETTKADENSEAEQKTEVAAAAPKKTEAEEIVETLTRRYTRNSSFYRDMDQQDVLELYLTSLAHVYDPHTDYFNPRQAENFAIGMNLTLYGIGA